MLSSIQQQVLEGALLGDAYVCKGNDNSKRSYLRIVRSSKDINYLQKQFEIFNNVINAPISIGSYFDKRTSKTYERCQFQSLSTNDFYDYRQKWYSSGKKTVPPDLILTPLSIAIWIADDGSIAAVDGKTDCRIQIATNSFALHEVNFLIEQLKQFADGAYKAVKVKDKEQYSIQFFGKPAREIVKLINPHLIEFEMDRKVKLLEDYTPERLRLLNVLFWIKSNPENSEEELYNSLKYDCKKLYITTHGRNNKYFNKERKYIDGEYVTKFKITHLGNKLLESELNNEFILKYKSNIKTNDI